MSTQIKVLKNDDLSVIVALEEALLDKLGLDPVESRLGSWSARWRQESLEHYLPLGWSFGLWSGDPEKKESELLAYFLAQPLLFFEGMTQSLWVEHLASREEHHRQEMIEVAYKMARDKHFQKVYFADGLENQNLVVKAQPEKLSPAIRWVKTAKFN